jgi:hypothetical protein
MSSLNCSKPGYDENCFNILGQNNPCRSEANIRYALPSAIVLWIFLLLLLYQSFKTSRSIIIRLPRSFSDDGTWYFFPCFVSVSNHCNTSRMHCVAYVYRFTGCFRQYPDFRVCVITCFSCLFTIISSIANCFTW